MSAPRFGRHHAFGAGAVFAGVVVAAAVGLWPSRRIADEHTMPAAARLSDAARATVRTQMHAHARGMLALASTVTVLDYEGAVAAADAVLAEPRVARPTSGDATELNAALPPRFFELQDQLRAELQAVRAAAGAHDGERLADSFGTVTVTCVRCHQTYQEGR
jgi:hypothetical protein